MDTGTLRDCFFPAVTLFLIFVHLPGCLFCWYLPGWLQFCWELPYRLYFFIENYGSWKIVSVLNLFIFFSPSEAPKYYAFWFFWAVSFVKLFITAIFYFCQRNCFSYLFKWMPCLFWSKICLIFGCDSEIANFSFV